MAEHREEGEGVPGQGTLLHALAGDRSLVSDDRLVLPFFTPGRACPAVDPDPVFAPVIVEGQRTTADRFAVQRHGRCRQKPRIRALLPP